jgi:glutamyl-tRNA reductase
MGEHLKSVDIVLASSAAPHFIIGPKQIQDAAPFRRGNALCLIDISVPRNVDPAVHELPDTYLYDIDDLEEVARDGRREREAVAERWRPRLAEEARELLRQLQDAGTKDAARKLLENAARIRAEVLAAVKSESLDARTRAELERALERLQNRLLHGPLDTLRQAAREGDGAQAAAWVTRLFRLEAPEGAAPDANTPPRPTCREQAQAARAGATESGAVPGGSAVKGEPAPGNNGSGGTAGTPQPAAG